MGSLDLKWNSSGCMVLKKVESTKTKGEDMSSLCGSSAYLYKRRGRRIRCREQRVNIVATGPAIDHAPVIAKPLTKDDLIDYFVSGCKPKHNWR